MRRRMCKFWHKSISTHTQNVGPYKCASSFPIPTHKREGPVKYQHVGQSKLIVYI
jgi:hypothetical protein